MGWLVRRKKERPQIRRKERAEVATLSTIQVAKAANDLPTIRRAAGAVERRRDFPLSTIIVEGNSSPTRIGEHETSSQVSKSMVQFGIQA